MHMIQRGRYDQPNVESSDARTRAGDGVLESIMFDRLHNYVQKTANEMMALHMAGPVEGFTVPVAAPDTPKA